MFHVHLQYKYQINIDGTVAAYRLPYLLSGDSVVLKQDSGYYEHFYNELRPWEHFIPIRADLGDLLEKIHWARDHDEEVMRIIHQLIWCDSMYWILIGFALLGCCDSKLNPGHFDSSFRQRKLHWPVNSLPAIISWETVYFVTTTNFSR